MAAHYPELPLYVVSEFPPQDPLPPDLKWIPYHVNRSFWENLACCRAAIRGKRIRLAGVLLVPRTPYRRMRLLALLLSPAAFLAYNEHFGSFMLRPRCAGTILRHLAWRARNFLRWQLNPGGDVYTFFWRLARPGEWHVPLLYRRALLAGSFYRLIKMMRRGSARNSSPAEEPASPAGISLVIPSRSGRLLLERLLPRITAELGGPNAEIIVVDNGSSDGSADWLRANYPAVIVEHAPQPLSFARAVNLGIRRCRYTHVCLLNNDMVVEPGFFTNLRNAFDAVPNLFCATAQIFFPPGLRREETGKAVLAHGEPTDFPVRCEEPTPGEDLTYVLYGSGGCSLYCAAKLRALGLISEIYEPAYVEDLDLGYRAWQRGWPTVFVASARVEHRHRATTSRYYSPDQLAAMLEINYLRFLKHSVISPCVFHKLWSDAVWRLLLLARKHDAAAIQALSYAGFTSTEIQPPPGNLYPERLFVALGSGSVAVFPGRAPRGNPVVLVASPYIPFPLSHGGAVRMYNLMRLAAPDHDLVLVCFVDRLQTPPEEILEICVEVVLVRRAGTHLLPSGDRPDVVEEFDSPAFHAALHQTVRKWRPAIAQLEFTQMAQYAADCAPAKTVLVEHDITVDLYQQLVRETGGWEHRRQLHRWRKFEAGAWRQVNAVVVMSDKDRRAVSHAPTVTLPNGVDLERFRPSAAEPEPGRLLFIGSFAHLPNLLGLGYFLQEVWTRLDTEGPVLHVIAGAQHDYFLRHYRDRLKMSLTQPRVLLEGFVADVRPAYARAAVVIAPLVASAGTNIKILEAMAMGKAIVTTSAGVNGLDVSPDDDLLLADSPGEMAAAILDLLKNSVKRRTLEQRARQTVERRYGWDAIARRQRKFYSDLMAVAAPVQRIDESFERALR